MNSTTSKPQGFYIEQWGVLGWAETGIKGIGIVAGVLAFLATSQSTSFRITDNPELGALILMALLTVMSLGILVVRLTQREIISILFAVASLIGHAALLIALLHGVEPIYPVLFALAFIVGEYFKQRFIKATGYTEAGQSPEAIRRISLVIAFVYALVVVFILI